MKELKELIDDMYFDWDRLSSSGKETLNKISRLAHTFPNENNSKCEVSNE